jgi:hypothetical protein
MLPYMHFSIHHLRPKTPIHTGHGLIDFQTGETAEIAKHVLSFGPTDLQANILQFLSNRQEQ